MADIDWDALQPGRRVVPAKDGGGKGWTGDRPGGLAGRVKLQAHTRSWWRAEKKRFASVCVLNQEKEEEPAELFSQEAGREEEFEKRGSGNEDEYKDTSPPGIMAWECSTQVAAGPRQWEKSW